MITSKQRRNIVKGVAKGKALDAAAVDAGVDAGEACALMVKDAAFAGEVGAAVGAAVRAAPIPSRGRKCAGFWIAGPFVSAVVLEGDVEPVVGDRAMVNVEEGYLCDYGADPSERIEGFTLGAMVDRILGSLGPGKVVLDERAMAQAPETALEIRRRAIAAGAEFRARSAEGIGEACSAFFERSDREEWSVTQGFAAGLALLECTTPRPVAPTPVLA